MKFVANNRMIFFDRDGVLIEDVDLLRSEDQVKIYPETFDAFKLLNEYDFKSIVVTNQPVVARGMISEAKVEAINEHISRQIQQRTNYKIFFFYYCPHHPNASLKNYRVNCACRKPKSGMLERAARDFNVVLKGSWMVGDRISDIIAGYNVGCKTILLQTGKHLEEPIQSDAMNLSIKPDFVCKNILDAVKLILNESDNLISR